MVFLLNRDGWGNACDRIDIWFIHSIEKLPDVGRKCLNVAALSLSVEGVEGEGGFSRSRWSSDNGQFTERNIEIDAFEVVLTATAEGNAVPNS